MKHPFDGYNKAIVYVPEDMLWKLGHGLILPEGYRIVERPPWYDNSRPGWGMMVESRDIPQTHPGTTLPSLEIYLDYNAIVVKRYET